MIISINKALEKQRHFYKRDRFDNLSGNNNQCSKLACLEVALSATSKSLQSGFPTAKLPNRQLSSENSLLLPKFQQHNAMKINKFIQEDFLTLSSIISLIIGSTVFAFGIIGVSIIEIEKVLNHQPPISEKIAVFSIATGGAGFGFGLLLMQASIFLGEQIGKDSTKHVPLPCKGCQNYHGVVYNGTAFICAIHPYGSPSKKCSDRSEGSPKQVRMRCSDE